MPLLCAFDLFFCFTGSKDDDDDDGDHHCELGGFCKKPPTVQC